MLAVLTRQEGSALITAMLVMTLCLMVGFTTLAAVDVQQSQSRGERERESSFALGEGALNAQIFMLSTEWPRTPTAAYPTCSQATAGQLNCPDPTTLVKAFTGADYDAGLQWSTEIHDNADTVSGNRDQFYQDAIVRSQPGYDANDDGLMWLRAQANLRGRRRTLVALVRAERLDLPFPRNVITANKLTVTNNGRKSMLNPNGSYLVLRCGTGSDCGTWDEDKGHLGGAEVRKQPGQRAGLSPETIDLLRKYAQDNGTYYAGGCPSLAGEVVFLERANCGYTSNNVWNSAEKPGVLVIGSGSLEISGNSTFYGVIYHTNGGGDPSRELNSTVLRIHGTGCIRGSVVVDGPGGLEIGSSGGTGACGDGNIEFDADAARELRAYGTAGIVQNSFREIVASN